jgi:hypothetical protein
MRYQDLVEDGHIPGLLVHPDWYEPRHPQELPVDTADAVALYRPAPELSANEGEFDELATWQAWVISDCPASPLDLQYFESTTLAADAAVGSMQFALEDFVSFEDAVCLYVELDGGGWFISKTSYGTLNQPVPVVGALTPFAGVAAAGNDVFIGPAGSAVAILNGSWVYTP